LFHSRPPGSSIFFFGLVKAPHLVTSKHQLSSSLASLTHAYTFKLLLAILDLLLLFFEDFLKLLPLELIRLSLRESCLFYLGVLLNLRAAMS
jgi:phosphoglycerol transferase MdoB-like AlkP superfamily enzyme